MSHPLVQYLQLCSLRIAPGAIVGGRSHQFLGRLGSAPGAMFGGSRITVGDRGNCSFVLLERLINCSHPASLLTELIVCVCPCAWLNFSTIGSTFFGERQELTKSRSQWVWRGRPAGPGRPADWQPGSYPRGSLGFGGVFSGNRWIKALKTPG